MSRQGHVVTLVLGTRPEAIKLAPVATALTARGMAVRILSTGQQRDLVAPTLAAFGLSSDVELDLMRSGAGLDALLGRLIPAIGTALAAGLPATVVVQGDTATALAGALAAAHARLPLAHVEAGLRSGDRDAPFPEEDYRALIGRLATLHLAPTEAARAALLREGIADAVVHVTGNSVVDALLAMRDRVRADPTLAPVVTALARQAAGRPILLATVHRREAIGAGIDRIAAALRRLASRSDRQLAIVLHPNPRVSAPIRAALDGTGALLLPPLDYPDFVAALDAATLVLSDSGGVQEEAPALGTPLLVLRDTTERPEGVAAGGTRIVGTNTDAIVTEAERLLADPAALAGMAVPRFPFGEPGAAARIADLIAAQPAERSPRPMPR